jgi:phage/plasmid-like protein (TIGR03299 family)
MAFTGESPWWMKRPGLAQNADGSIAMGYPVSNDLTPEQMADIAKITWTVDKLPVYNFFNGEYAKVDGKFNLTRMTDGRVLDVVGSMFKCTQNLDAVRFFSEFVRAGDMRMETMGALCGGQRIWALARIGANFTLKGGDRVEVYLLLSLPHKQGEAITVKLTKVRVVCRNTEQMALNGWGSAWRMSHVHEFDADMQQAAKEALGLAREAVIESAKVADMLSETKVIDGAKLIEYVATVSGSKLLDDVIDNSDVASGTGGETSFLDAAIQATNSAKMARAFRDTDLNKAGRVILESILTSPGSDLESARGTWWGALNGVTHAVDHVLGNSDETRLSASWFGQRSGLKTQASELAVKFAQAA